MLGVLGIISPFVIYMIILQHPDSLPISNLRTYYTKLITPTFINHSASTSPSDSSSLYSSVSKHTNLSRLTSHVLGHSTPINSPTPSKLNDSPSLVLSASTPLVMSLLNQSSSRTYTDDIIHNTNLPENISVAIGLGITSKLASRSKPKNGRNPLHQMPLFSQLLPTFCGTASKGYTYHFYFAYDFNDTYFANDDNFKLWKQKFHVEANKCAHLGDVGIHMIKCNYSGKPAWAQNDAMMAAYHDGRDFFYRVNDDTLMKTSNWTKLFINELQKMVPPLIGVVGPNHRGGNVGILTYDFVHRTHIDIFGYYYPREFPWWYADNWITKVYEPGRSKKLNTVRLDHIVGNTRYKYKMEQAQYVSSIVSKSSERLQR